MGKGVGSDLLAQYFRCPGFQGAGFHLPGALSADPGYFSFGDEIICYGKTSTGYRHRQADMPLYNAENDVSCNGPDVFLPFDPSEVALNLTQERYLQVDHKPTSGPWQHLYYAVRPLLPMPVRSILQRLHYQWRHTLPFPRGPVNTTVDKLAKKLLFLWLKAAGVESIPFIWFWPDGARACAIMTHDVEAKPGKDFCPRLMDLDEQANIPASFQIVPEDRYEVTPEFIADIKSRGFEVNVQDLNHDGRLFWNYGEFERRAARINHFGREFGAAGFRSAVLYRRQEWFDRLQFQYDMSVPNVGSFEPQQGGCCTVKPYFVGELLELPATTTQDHVLFNVLGDYSLDLWKRQADLILGENGLISFIVHPDYLIGQRAQAIYKELLAELSFWRTAKDVWISRPGDVNTWWRQRAAMTFEYRQGQWVIEGPGKERACVALASIVGDELVYKLPERVAC